jgi:nitroimidazol reductase NimA-like FMN-containing flavoprotein (pyridoxamine 5'-phosphate oxidase superfamily)
MLDGSAFSGAEAAFVSERRIGYLASVYLDGRPHLVPISPVLDMDRLVFATERATQKVRNLRGDPNVVVGFDEYHEDWRLLRQVIAHGEAYLVESGPEFMRDRALLYEKYPQYEAQAPIDEETSVIVEVRVDRVVSWGF